MAELEQSTKKLNQTDYVILRPLGQQFQYVVQ